MKYLFVTDMDGTLLDRSSKVSSKSAAIISALSAQGALITVATARTPATVEPLLAHVRTNLPAIVMTGAALWDRADRRFIYPRFLDTDTVGHINRICRESGIAPFRYRLASNARHLDVFHTPALNQAEQLFYDQRRHLELKQFHLFHEADSAPHDRNILFFATGPAARIAEAAHYIGLRRDCAVSTYPDIFIPDTGIIEVMAPGISKADAVKRLATAVGADYLTVFGDNLNDLPMMAVADEAVAVANAMPEVKASADIVIGSNADDSVAKYIHARVAADASFANIGAQSISQTAS